MNEKQKALKDEIDELQGGLAGKYYKAKHQAEALQRKNKELVEQIEKLQAQLEAAHILWATEESELRNELGAMSTKCEAISQMLEEVEAESDQKQYQQDSLIESLRHDLAVANKTREVQGVVLSGAIAAMNKLFDGPVEELVDAGKREVDEQETDEKQA